jgi:hypothetical protein
VLSGHPASAGVFIADPALLLITISQELCISPSKISSNDEIIRQSKANNNLSFHMNHVNIFGEI